MSNRRNRKGEEAQPRLRYLSELRFLLEVGTTVQIRTNRLGQELRGAFGKIVKQRKDRWLSIFTVRVGKQSYEFTGLELDPVAGHQHKDRS